MNIIDAATGAKPKGSKRPRRCTPTQQQQHDDEGREADQLVSVPANRQKRKHASSSSAPSGASTSSVATPSSGVPSYSSAENKRRDSIKCGLEELQRVLPHVGTPEEEKVGAKKNEI